VRAANHFTTRYAAIMVAQCSKQIWMVTMHPVNLAHWNQLQPGVFRQDIAALAPQPNNSWTCVTCRTAWLAFIEPN
jgi:hypothetical protein